MEISEVRRVKEEHELPMNFRHNTKIPEGLWTQISADISYIGIETNNIDKVEMNLCEQRTRVPSTRLEKNVSRYKQI